MGSAAGYTCAECGYRAGYVADDFSYGFSGDVLTPVVCAEHGIISANTGINVMRDGLPAHRKRKFPCRECGVISPRWNRRSCPKCGGSRMQKDSEIMWD